MEEDLKVAPRYRQGFEHGYWLEKGQSKEANNAFEQAKAGDKEYYAGLVAGKKEATREQVRNRMQGNSGQSSDVQKDIDME